MGDAGSVGSVSQGVRHDAPARHPGRGPVPCGAAREPAPRRVPPPGAERDVSVTAAASDDPLYRARRLLTMAARTPRRPAANGCFGLLARRRSHAVRCSMAWHAKEVVRSDLRPSPTRTLAAVLVAELGRRLPRRRRARPRCAGSAARSCAGSTRSSPGTAATSHERTDRSDQQPRQAHQAGRVRDDQLRTNYRTRALLYAGRPNWSLLHP